MRDVSLSALEDAIVRPGIEKRLVPLLHFKGHADLGRFHRLWNLLVSMHEHECAGIGEGVYHLALNPAHSQLCLPVKRVPHTTLYGFLSRLQSKPAVANERPGLLDYARFLMPRPWDLVPVAARSKDRRHAWWRTFEAKPREPRKFRLREAPLSYPFLIHDGGRPEHDLLHMINAAVPSGIMGDLRADICQDLAVGVLCGDFPKDALLLPAKEVIRRVRKMFPDKYGPMSLDALVPGTNDLRLIDTI
jgi:hypothetical protein